jgi:hypothetical protein
VLRGDEYPERDVRGRGQTAHSLIFVAHGGAPPRVSGAKSAARSRQIRLTSDRMTVSSIESPPLAHPLCGVHSVDSQMFCGRKDQCLGRSCSSRGGAKI